MGTWNLRNFDDDRFNYGPRLTESLYYITEIISRFDVIAFQEICVDLYQTKFYDQISFKSKKNQLTFLESDREDRVIQFFNSIFRKEDYESYKPIMKERIEMKLKDAKKELKNTTTKKSKEKLEKQIVSLTAAKKTEVSLREYYEEWRTFQMSDHLPLWV